MVGPGSVREFVVLREDRDLQLSLKRMEAVVAWQRLRQLLEEEVSFSAKVVAVNRGEREGRAASLSSYFMAAVEIKNEGSSGIW